jgi:ligand-binding SRPBCC domain-containing protein
METIRLETWIDAPVERCFLLSLNIDLHVASARSTREQAIDGVTTGQIGEGETVTFRARHFGLWQRHTARVEALRPYSYFRDVMVDGVFHRFEHEHHFAAMNDGTRMRDAVRFSAPWGRIGRSLARRKLVRLLIERSGVIKRTAESEEWRKYLDTSVKIHPAFPIGAEPRRWDPNGLLRSPRQVATDRSTHG